MECWLYLSLFPNGLDAFSLIFFWIMEGFIDGFQWLYDGIGEGESILNELNERQMFQVEDTYDGTRIPSHIKSKLFAVTIESSRGRRFPRDKMLLKSDMALTQAPNAEEWEDKVRISLSFNQIQSLFNSPPNCPTLSTLFLHCNPLRKIPDSFFEHMNSLRLLHLSKTHISSLPSSLSCLCNLRMLFLSSCPCLYTLPLPLIQSLPKLEALVLGGTPIKNLIPKASFEYMPNLRLLDIAIINAYCITQVSVRGCRSLEDFSGISQLKNLEVLDLSGTRIRFLPNGFEHLTQLTRLDLLDTKYLKNVNWDGIVHLPKELNWDQCCFDLPTQCQVRGRNGYCISVTDANIFRTLDAHSPLWEKYIHEFHLYVGACEERGKAKDDPFERTEFYYGGIYSHIKIQHPTPTSYSTSFEIGSTESDLNGIGGVLYHTKFLSLQKNQFIITLSHCGIKNTGNLIECRIEKCYKMKSLIVGQSADIDALESLEKLSMFHLANLSTVCEGIVGHKSFTSLNCIYLESCPKLVSLFSSGIHLKKLEILEIKSCKILESLFQDDQAGQDAFPSLRSLYLWELPKLKSICQGYLPALEMMKVKGCPNLRKLPLYVGDSITGLKISGEPNWWNNLVWEDTGIKNHIHFEERSPFTLESFPSTL
ncbi:disease resistance protein RPS2-like [Tasmannia lanceolata]|uniref:disease resistance protein RPS2-like n=1 Tax=Tasmannia lanceolata TaxID=3420 RepID=UPI004062AC52